MTAQGLFRGVKEDFYDLAHSLNSWRFWRTVGMMVLGLTLFSIAINAILIPHKFLASGATGLALALYYLLGQPSPGVIYWLINIPILFVGYRTMSLKYVVVAVLGVAISGATMELTQGVAIPTTDPLMAAIIAGCLSGMGVGLYLRYGGSAGGVDIVAAVLRRKAGVSMGTTFIAVNAINVLAGGLLAHDLAIAFYTSIAMVVHSHMVDRMQSGFSARKTAFIVSTKPDAIAEQVLRRLNRGVTFLNGTGGIRQNPVRIVYTVINMIELARLKEIIFDLDPSAFVAVSDTAEVIGNRFVTWEDQGFNRRISRLPAAAKAKP